jgi:hypothetical protein
MITITTTMNISAVPSIAITMNSEYSNTNISNNTNEMSKTSTKSSRKKEDSTVSAAITHDSSPQQSNRQQQQQQQSRKSSLNATAEVAGKTSAKGVTLRRSNSESTSTVSVISKPKEMNRFVLVNLS